MHPNSLKAYRELRNLPESRARILQKFLDHEAYGLFHEGFTDREIKEMFIPPLEMDRVRPRITELIDLGLLYQCSNDKCKKTKATVRRCKAV